MRRPRAPATRGDRRASCAPLLYVEDNPANLKLVEQLIARRAGPAPADARSTATLGIELRARLPAGRDPDGHQPARHQRHRALTHPARRPGDGAHPGHRAERQRDAARHREGPGGRASSATSPSRSRSASSWSAGRRARTFADDSGRRRSQANRMMHRRTPTSSSAQHPDRRRPGGQRAPARADAARRRLHQRHLDHGPARGLRAAPRAPLRPDPARPADARHGRLPGDGGAQDDRARRLPAGAGDHRAAGPQAARAAGRRQDFVSKPFDLVEVQTRIHNMLEVRLLHQETAAALRPGGGRAESVRAAPPQRAAPFDRRAPQGAPELAADSAPR